MMCKGGEDGVSHLETISNLKALWEQSKRVKVVCSDSETSFNSFHFKKVMHTWNQYYIFFLLLGILFM